MEGRTDLEEELRRIDEKTIECACDVLRQHGKDVFKSIANFVASLCNVDCGRMLSFGNKSGTTQPRWLFWYAYRYMTNESYERISEVTNEIGGYMFTVPAVGQGVNKMAQMIESEPIWKKRWTIIRGIIKGYYSERHDEEENRRITIRVPKGFNVELKEK